MTIPRLMFNIGRGQTFLAGLGGIVVFVFGAPLWLALFITTVMLVTGYGLMCLATELDPPPRRIRRARHDAPWPYSPRELEAMTQEQLKDVIEELRLRITQYEGNDLDEVEAYCDTHDYATRVYDVRNQLAQTRRPAKEPS